LNIFVRPVDRVAGLEADHSLPAEFVKKLP